ncbi:MAG: hypothetical protein ACAI43_17600 [Phycisphaerae bacterium]|nr:hypothetical protein [Tepidisphaeraceae bacterium]
MEPLYRRSYDAAALLRDHPPVFRHAHKAALFDVAYPGGAGASGTIDVTRWAAHVLAAIELPAGLATEVRPAFYDYAPTAGVGHGLEWHVNFADPRVFAAYGSGLLAQDEMQVVEHPLLGSVREALLAEGLAAKTTDETGPTPILVRGVERRLGIATDPDVAAGRPLGLYGNRFAAAPLDVVLRAARRVDPPAYSNVIAMAAPSGGRGDYTEGQVGLIFQIAHTAFAAAVQETRAARGAGAETVVHTGFWGCGAFGGNRRLMVAVQALAARAAGVGRLVVHAGDPAGAADAERGLEVGEDVADRCGRACGLDTIAGRMVILGYRWGVSDGN